ncbi:MAG TPA: RNA-binding cell elongation regulator Jag/EloR [Candidatus Cloacimonadota bacterium]|nr:RNA-binding cell elongation regulator Jag/EloR [Candidatus Cloacimonadota bacterium]
MKTIEKTAKTVDLAIQDFKKEYKLNDNQFTYEVVQEPTSSFLGLFGGKDAIVKFTVTNYSEEIRLYLFDFFNHIQMSFDVIEIENIDHVYKVTIINPTEPGVIIGKDGNFLNDLEYLLNLSILRNQEVEGKIILDVDNYRQRRANTLKRDAEIAMAKVLKTRVSVSLNPLISAERRLIHHRVQEDKRFKTTTIGDGRKKTVVISLAKKGFSNKNQGNRKTFKSTHHQHKQNNHTQKTSE